MKSTSVSVIARRIAALAKKRMSAAEKKYPIPADATAAEIEQILRKRNRMFR